MIALLLSGCFQKYKSIKHISPYDTLVKASYYSLVPLRLQGVTHDPQYKKVISAYSLRPPPGVSGPEIVSVTKLPVGTIIKIHDVQSCTNCFFVPLTSMIVEIPSYEKKINLPIRLRTKLEEDISGHSLILDSRYFKRIQSDGVTIERN